MRTILTSHHNPLLKEIRRAADRAELTTDGYCVSESIHLLQEAVRSKRPIQAVIGTDAGYQRLTDLRLPPSVAQYELSQEMFQGLARTETSQGVIALVQPPEAPADWSAVSLTVIVDSVQDPGNVGTLLRSAEAFGADAVILLKGTASAYNPKCVRASAGALWRIPVWRSVELPAAAALAQQHGWHVYAAEAEASRSLWEIDWRPSSAIVIGNEGSGIDPRWREQAERVAIPMVRAESLNAAIAGSVLLYEAYRQRRSNRE